MRRKRRILGYTLVTIWVVFTVSLVSWWMIFGIRQAGRLAVLDVSASQEISSHQWMLVWEGMTMIFSLVIGATFLFYYLYRQIEAGNQIKEFFAALTHEIKTPISSAKLQLEILKEKLLESPHEGAIQKIEQELSRLTLQLENSLFIGDEGSKQPILQGISVKEIVERLSDRFVGINAHCISDINILADQRMIESIFGNIFQNSKVHGKATDITVDCRQSPDNKLIKIKVCDNGCGFSGNKLRVGKLFYRHYTGSGSGIGLYLVRKLMSSMGGSVEIPDLETDGFLIELNFRPYDLNSVS